MPAQPRAQDSTVVAERRVLGAALIEQHLPAVALSQDDFEDLQCRDIFGVMLAVTTAGQPITTVNVWKRDPSIDPLMLCELEADFAMDESAHGFLLDAFALTVKLTAQRREPVAA